MAHEHLKKLLTAIVDACNGYEEAAKDAETPALADFFASIERFHRLHIAELGQAMASAGETPDESGSFMSAIHTGVIAVRSSVTGLKPALPAFASGEEKLIESYDVALGEDQPSALRQILVRQKSDLQDKIDDIRKMAAAAG